MAYPYEWIDVPHEEVVAAIRNPTRDYVRSVPGDVWMPKAYQEIAERMYNFEVRKEDVWVVTYPKCGTTWTQELVWHIVHGVDIEGSKAAPLWARSPFLEFQAMAPKAAQEMLVSTAPDDKRDLMKNCITDTIGYADSLPSPRVIKSHMPLSMLPPALFTSGCKVIYVCRNPKDACVSFYHHNQLLKDEYAEDFEHFQKMFMDGTFVFGSYWHHLKDAQKYKDQPNLRMVWYEDMKKNFSKVIRDTATFIGYELTDEQVATLTEFLDIKTQKKHGPKSMSNGNEQIEQAMSKFFRKGEVGDWKNHFSGENLQKWDDWIENNLGGTDIKMSFE